MSSNLLDQSSRGVLYVHSAPGALCPHVEWAAAAVFGDPARFDWTVQPAERSSYRTEFAWTGPAGTAARLTSAFQGWQRIRFEVTEDPTATSEGVRYAYTPDLGVFQAAIGQHGDIMVPEERIKHAIATDALGGKDLLASLDELLGRPWDDELEVFRHAGEDAPVRWLHQVV
ncbi:DUF3145 domain-containing protein [Propionibacteriaceae bacterium Y2011]|uniref:DUF3145 domain-containing protein n=1 Tax=Microlunatus sp. Y2014 TaxID=3418488 RepID=UPI003B4A0234